MLPDPAANGADFIVLLGATTVDNYYLYLGYPWCWYYPCCAPGWGCWYPPSVGASYAYTTGTLITLMVNPDTTGVSQNDDSQIMWSGAINGILNDTDEGIQMRLQRDIPQMFSQSPYLGTTP